VSPQKVGLVIVCVFLFTLAFSGIGSSAPEDMHNVYSLEYGGLEVEVWAPYQARPGDTIDVTVSTKAADHIYVKYLNVDFYGVENASTEVTLAEITHLENSSLTSHEAEYEITIPDQISTGLTYGEISCEWELMGAPAKIPRSGFVLTYIENTEFEELQRDYDELNATYHSTLEDYTQLSKDKGEVDSTRNLMYIFVATTIVATITVGVLLVRKPKKVWV
jgi:hypothetical protein